MRHYLESDTSVLVELGATALGHMRLVRARPHLINRYSSGGDLEIPTLRTLLYEIARIGGADAVSFLRERGDDRFAQAALSHCLDSASDTEFENLVEQAMRGEADEAWWVFRAIGRRPSERLLHFLEEGLSSGDPSDRGVAALALAKATGTDSRPRIEVARTEASMPLEQALTAMALLVATGDTTIVQQVEDQLAEDAWRYEPLLFDEVLSALAGWGGLPGQDLAMALRWVHSAA